jgi:hypothetical protein
LKCYKQLHQAAACAGTCREHSPDQQQPEKEKKISRICNRERETFNLSSFLSRPTVAMVATTWFLHAVSTAVCSRLLSRYAINPELEKNRGFLVKEGSEILFCRLYM